MFTAYIIILMPFILWYYIHATRKIQDVSIHALFSMVVISIIPFFRELVCVLLFFHNNDITLPKVVFKKYKA